MGTDVPKKCGHCGHPFDVLEEGEDYVVAECTFCEILFMNPPRGARSMAVATRGNPFPGGKLLHVTYRE